jgi:hypothetical protein
MEPNSDRIGDLYGWGTLWQKKKLIAGQKALAKQAPCSHGIQPALGSFFQHTAGHRSFFCRCLALQRKPYGPSEPLWVATFCRKNPICHSL